MVFGIIAIMLCFYNRLGSKVLMANCFGNLHCYEILRDIEKYLYVIFNRIAQVAVPGN
jgi:hypothetical protein